MTVIAVLAVVIAGGITLREHEAAPAGEVVKVSIDGVELKDSTQVVEVGWDRIWSVEGEQQVRAEEFRPLSDKLFRARKRLERRDLVMAEPMLEELAASHGEARGPTGAMLHTLRTTCRLLRGGQMAALEPYGRFLSCFSDEQLRGGLVRVGGRSLEALPLNARPASVLVPDLPPVWLEIPALRAVGGAGVEQLHGKARELVNLYVLAAAFESGDTVQIPGIDLGEDGDLVRDMVLARAGDAAQRAKAREQLKGRIKPGMEGWRESWIHVGIGRSLIREDDVDTRLAGVEQMLYAPAQFADATPYLAGVALAESAVVLKQVADPVEADQLVLELRDKYPHHAAHDWRPIREWVLTQRKAPSAGGTTP